MRVSQVSQGAFDMLVMEKVIKWINTYGMNDNVKELAMDVFASMGIDTGCMPGEVPEAIGMVYEICNDWHIFIAPRADGMFYVTRIHTDSEFSRDNVGNLIGQMLRNMVIM